MGIDTRTASFDDVSGHFFGATQLPLLPSISSTLALLRNAAMFSRFIIAKLFMRLKFNTY
jgi:hypothetical protein